MGKITPIHLQTVAFFCRKGHGMLFFGALDGLGCLKSYRLPFRHRPRRMRKGQGVEDFKAKFCPLSVPSLLAINDCLETGSALQNLIWDIFVRNRFKPIALSGDLKQALPSSQDQGGR